MKKKLCIVCLEKPGGFGPTPFQLCLDCSESWTWSVGSYYDTIHAQISANIVWAAQRARTFERKRARKKRLQKWPARSKKVTKRPAKKRKQKEDNL